MKRPLELLPSARGTKKQRVQVDLSAYRDKPWFSTLHWAIGVDPQRLPCVGVFEFYNTDERADSQQTWAPGYPLDLIENPALQFCIYKDGVMQKLFLVTQSIFEGAHVKALDLVTRKVKRVGWMELSQRGFTCNYYCNIKHVSWKSASKQLMPLLRDEHVCHVEYFDTEDYPVIAKLMATGMERISEVVKEEFDEEPAGDEDSQTTQLIADTDERDALQSALQEQLVKRVQMGAYKSLRGYYRQLYHPGYHSFTDADKWADKNGGVKAAAQCTVTLPASCIRAITVANTKYMFTDL